MKLFNQSEKVDSFMLNTNYLDLGKGFEIVTNWGLQGIS